MSTKFSTAISKGEDSYKVGIEVAEQAIAKANLTKVDFSIVFCSTKYNYEEVIRGIREVTKNAPLIGCSSAGEFTEEKTYKGSVACALISSDEYKFFTGCASGLREDELRCFENALKDLPKDLSYPYQSSIILIDGLAGKGEESVMTAISLLGPNYKIVGGSAGDDLKFEKTYVFCNDKVLDNGVSIATIFSTSPVFLGVKHGHKPISPPLRVTKAKNNVVYEIENKPAFEVWKYYTKDVAKEIGIDVENLTKEEEEDIVNFFTRFEAGLLTGSGDYKIRWLGGTKSTDGPIVFTSCIPEGTILRIMESPKQAQIDSAKEAAELAFFQAAGGKIVGAIVFDCVCRATILGEDFSKAINGIKDVLKVPLVGFETYGEIHVEPGQTSGFHNTTTVVMLFSET
ncbi:MAG: FIST C-terminal domain-containing protein [Endomicrobia bacterium]|nr:FIST C-terminal domain-containing protein [Endomicrobiia bacterium]